MINPRKIFKENKIAELLRKLNLCNENTICEYYPRVRDNEKTKVIKCNKCGIFFLSQYRYSADKYYREMKSNSYWSKMEKITVNQDDRERAKKYLTFIKNKKWVDVGTGMGGILKLLKKDSKISVGVEPQKEIRRVLIKKGFKVFENISQLKDNYFETATLFHVLEHVINPLDLLQYIRKKLVKDGIVIVEVPHAKDFLISVLNLKSYKDFTFWSEHLILHTKKSLTIFLKKSGFKKIMVLSYQRYFLANHLYWLLKGKPGGHIYWRFLDFPLIKKFYAFLLDKIDCSDTIVAIAKK